MSTKGQDRAAGSTMTLDFLTPNGKSKNWTRGSKTQSKKDTCPRNAKNQENGAKSKLEACLHNQSMEDTWHFSKGSNGECGPKESFENFHFWWVELEV